MRAAVDRVERYRERLWSEWLLGVTKAGAG